MIKCKFIDFSDASKITFLRDLQPLKIDSPNYLTDNGIEISVNEEQSLNTHSPNFVKEDGIDISFKEVHF